MRLTPHVAQAVAERLLQVAHGRADLDFDPGLHPALIGGAAVEISRLAREGELERIERMIEGSSTLKRILLSLPTEHRVETIRVRRP